MCTAAPHTGRDHDTLLPALGAFAAALVLGLLTAGIPQPAAAQAAVPCTAIADDAERLACYDRALRTAPEAPAAPTPAAQEPAASAAQAAPVAAQPAAAPPAAAATTAAAPAAPSADQDETVAIVIVGVRALPGRETTFTAEDGVNWVQTDSQRVVGLPATPFEAELKAGAMGSKFLLPAGRSRAIRVRALDP
jgi:hypothetical protein